MSTKSSSKGHNFKIGSKVFYPTHGAGSIKAQKNIEFQGEKKKYFEFKFIDAQLTVSTPVENVEMLGVRPVMSARAIKSGISVLKKKPAKKPKQADYNELIKHIQELDSRGALEAYVEIIQLCNGVMKQREKEGRLIPISIKKHAKTSTDHLIAELAVSSNIDLAKAAKQVKTATGLDIDLNRY